MNLINVTTWSGRKLHLVDPNAEQRREWGSWTPTLCDAAAVKPGGRWVRSQPCGVATQEFIDSLPPCKKCAKIRETLERKIGVRA